MAANDEEDKKTVSAGLFGWLRRGNRADKDYVQKEVEVGPEGEWKVTLSKFGSLAWATLFGLIVTALGLVTTAINAITTAINALTVIQTDIKKQGQIRLLAGVAFTTTGTPTALFTAGAAYNNVKVTIVNTSSSTQYTFELRHQNSAGSTIGKHTGTAYPLEANGATEIDIGGMASGDKIMGNASNAAIWLTVKGATE